MRRVPLFAQCFPKIVKGQGGNRGHTLISKTIEVAGEDIDAFIKEYDKFVEYWDEELHITHAVSAKWTESKDIKRRLTNLRSDENKKVRCTPPAHRPHTARTPPAHRPHLQRERRHAAKKRKGPPS